MVVMVVKLMIHLTKINTVALLLWGYYFYCIFYEDSNHDQIMVMLMVVMVVTGEVDDTLDQDQYSCIIISIEIGDDGNDGGGGNEV